LIIGLISGILYNSNILGMKNWRFPKFIQNIFKKYVAPIVGIKKTRSLSIPTQNINNTHRSQIITPNEEYIKLLKDMGFTNEDRIKQALIQTNNDPTR